MIIKKCACQTVADSWFTRIVFLTLLFSSLLIVSGCETSSRSYALAPPPPTKYPVIVERDREPITTIDNLASIETAAGLPAVDDIQALAIEGRTRQESHCRVQDRFDRKYAIAYQWGRDERNRLGLDVDGIGFDSMDLEGVKLEYTLRFQAAKPKKERCRYKSSWQGMVGTGYHELFVRDQDTVWQDLHKLEDDISTRFDTLTGY